MSIWAIILILYFAANAISGVAMVGKTQRITPASAAFMLVVYAGLIWAVFLATTG